MTEISDDALALVTRLVDLHADLAEITEQVNDIKARLRAQLPPDTYTADGAKVVTITPNRRFDPARAETVLPPELLTLCRVSKVDSAAAKKVLPPALYEQCMADLGDPVVRLA